MKIITKKIIWKLHKKNEKRLINFLLRFVAMNFGSIRLFRHLNEIRLLLYNYPLEITQIKHDLRTSA